MNYQPKGESSTKFIAQDLVAICNLAVGKLKYHICCDICFRSFKERNSKLDLYTWQKGTLQKQEASWKKEDWIRERYRFAISSVL